MHELKDKVAIVTGGGGGIGGAIARHFAREGVRIAVADINAESAQQRAVEITGQGGDAFTVVVDVTNKKSVHEMVRLTLERWGKIDILVNVAGGADPKLVIDMEESDWDRIVNMNLKSVFLCSQAVLPTMIQQRYGKIVSISSIYGFTGCETRSNYAAAKAGVAVFTKSLALEVAKDSINVNAIAPGQFPDPEQMTPEQFSQREERGATGIPLGRFGRMRDVGLLAVYLVSEAASYITGATIPVDGGRTIV